MKKIMAILNLTPDSFYPGSRLLDSDGRFDEADFVARVEKSLEQGADIIDLGACSTRPGSRPVEQEEEWARLQPALAIWREHFREVPLSVDTFRADVALRCAEYSDRLIVNDVAAGDERMLSAVVSMGCGYVAMHHDTLSEQASAVEQVSAWYAEFERQAEAAGLRDWWFDPGFGFGKTLRQNWTILRNLEKLPHHRPILVGLSRKRMFYNLLAPLPAGGPTDAPPAPASRPETLLLTRLAHRLALSCGASIFRVHDPARVF